MKGLTPEQAAEKAGMPLSYFRNTMSRLNKTERDLRLPVESGERFRRYSPQKLAAWIKDGKPVPETKLGNSIESPLADAQHLKAVAQRSEDGTSWIMTIEKPSILAESSNYSRALTMVRKRAAALLGSDVESVAIDVELAMPMEVKELYQRRSELQKLIKDAQRELQDVQHELVPALDSLGWTVMDIGIAVGYSRVWVEEILKAEKG